MKTVKFYIRELGKKCGFASCNRKGFFLLPTREGMSGLRFTVWVSCGHSHKGGN